MIIQYSGISTHPVSTVLDIFLCDAVNHVMWKPTVCQKLIFPTRRWEGKFVLTVHSLNLASFPGSGFIELQFAISLCGQEKQGPGNEASLNH